MHSMMRSAWARVFALLLLACDTATVASAAADRARVTGAYHVGLDDAQGSIEQAVDRVLVDRNLFDIPSAEITEAGATRTVFVGRTVFQSPR